MTNGRPKGRNMIAVDFEKGWSAEYETLEAATEGILASGDRVERIYDTLNDKEYGCEWSLKIVEL